MPAGIALSLDASDRGKGQTSGLAAESQGASVVPGTLSPWPAHLKRSLSKAGLIPAMDSIQGMQGRRSLDYLCKGGPFNMVGRTAGVAVRCT